MPKRNLRHQMLARRRGIDVAEYRAASLLVQRAFMSTSEFRRAKVLALYHAVHNEVATSLVHAAALADGKTVIYPVVTGGSLVFRQVVDDKDLHAGTYDIREPLAVCPEVAIGEAEAVIVPGVAYDLRGQRIGYGKGYYDKVLHQLEGQGRLIGFCFDFQVVEELKGEPHDVQMDIIITDRRVIRPRD
jgi:5-formyltetrahydrofolate cyclo-ligase